MPAKPYTVFFKDIDKEDLPLAGGKGANLGEMTKAGFPVPNGFAITVPAYDAFMEHNKIANDIAKILKITNVSNTEELESAANRIQKKIKSSEIPEGVGLEIIRSYKKLSGIFRNALVAIRSSATAEDLPNASFAGQQATFLNISGEANLINYTRECWASLYTPRAIFYREQNKISHDKVKISVIVQKMIQSEVSGVMFTQDPVTNEKDKIIIEAIWGLGEMIVQGTVVPDHYVVQKETFDVLSKQVVDQSIQLIRVKGTTLETGVRENKKHLQKISDKEIVAVAKLGAKLQKHYYFPQDVEWAKEKNKIYIVQTRPITTIKKSAEILKGDKGEFKIAQAPILTGSGASPGIGTGPVRIAKTPKEIGKVGRGDVLVSVMTSPDFVPAMKKAAAIVTDEGGQTSHAAIVSRELGIPCVVGTKKGTTTLKEDQIVTVDGKKGMVFMGGAVAKTEAKVVPQKSSKKFKTATRVYVNLAEPERAREIAKMNVEGVGLLRAEFMIANIGIHPKEALKHKTQGDFINKLASHLITFCEAFDPRPVVYRATDFKTNEYRSLPGGAAWEPEESNPMLGYRGAFRYIANPEVFGLELAAIKKVREKHKNLWLMIPFVRSPEELSKVKRLVASEGLLESPSFKFWMMVELPVNIIQFEDFVKVGIDGISIGSNDLTMLILGTDRDNAEVASAFDERTPAVLWALERVIKSCHKHGISSSICGQAPSQYDDLVEKLVGYGITSISVNPDSIERARLLIHNAEKKVGKR
ncbi:phosphoenolpyruvate synthase [Candidatus Woesebacteria bacterium RIFCSPHIGHO2_12_FULL_42_9]|uniref:Phosphoenolpyruvate synthase n=1 Tax=Candidatus Woesebacteria bacterium RIFCSPHIGHO2_12_FULL_42_9 TaxID=1802511 RepID=A0A1F8AXW2_9BACT|nr:MAG: phosphoenolpyruvate synthase [Candidatus Woesebacteria bacterium RIFCSPHIGHO2_12_FULL_42_9]